MAKPAHRSYSRYAREAAELLGLMIRNARIERGITAAEVAERRDFARPVVHRIEKGEMGSSIGAAFELAAIIGLRLFEASDNADAPSVDGARQAHSAPQSVRTANAKVKDTSDHPDTKASEEADVCIGCPAQRHRSSPVASHVTASS